VLPNVKAWQHADGCHYNKEGSAQLGKQVADAIQQALTQPKPRP